MTKELYDKIDRLKQKLEITALLHDFNFQHVEVLELSRKLDQLIVKANNLNLNKYKKND